jgi:ribonuclease HI
MRNLEVNNMRTRAFTDGACSGNPGPGGWGAIIFLPETSIELSGFELDTTNNRMELVAVIETLEYLIKKKIHDKVDIYSDSAYVINALTKGWLKNWERNNWKTKAGDEVKNIDLWKRLICLRSKYEGKDIGFIKIKGHSGHIHNERVDLLAKSEVERAKTYLED